MAVDVAKHGRRNVDREDVVRIGEEADTGDHADFYVEPTGVGSREGEERGGERLETYENLAVSISARAALRFSSRA